MRGPAQRGRPPRSRPPRGRPPRGFTLVEVLVALMIVALSLAALMNSISSAARGSEYLRDKTIAQWIAMNRIEEVRLQIQSAFGQSGDKGEVDFANRKWRYDTRYFDTNNASIGQVIVRVWPGSAKKDAGPMAEAASFLGKQVLAMPGTSTVSWPNGPPQTNQQDGANGAGTPRTNANPGTGQPANGQPPATGGQANESEGG